MKAKREKKHQCPELLSRRAYQQFVNKAQEFAAALTGDSGYERPDVNRVALEAMLVGWLRSTAFWERWDAHCREFHPRDDIHVIAHDQAAQAAYDALMADGELLAYFYHWEELQQMIEEAPFRDKCRLALTVSKINSKNASAKAKLGYAKLS